MSDSFYQLENRLSPVLKYGSPISTAANIGVAYDGTFLPYFLLAHDGNPAEYRTFLKRNQIGSVFEDLPDGRRVHVEKVAQSTAIFSVHAEA